MIFKLKNTWITGIYLHVVNKSVKLKRFYYKSKLNLLWDMYRNRDPPHHNLDLWNFNVVVSVNDFWYVDDMWLVDNEGNVMRNFYYFNLLFAAITTTRDNPSIAKWEYHSISKTHLEYLHLTVLLSFFVVAIFNKHRTTAPTKYHSVVRK